MKNTTSKKSEIIWFDKWSIHFHLHAQLPNMMNLATVSIMRINLVYNVLLNLVQGNHFRILCNTVANLKKPALTLVDPKVG